VESTLRADAPFFQDGAKFALDSPPKAIVLDLCSALPETGFGMHDAVAPFLPTAAPGLALFDQPAAELETAHSFGFMADESLLAGMGLETGFYPSQLEYQSWFEGDACLLGSWSTDDAMSARPWPSMDLTIDEVGPTMGFGEFAPWTKDQHSWESAAEFDTSLAEPADAQHEVALRHGASDDWVSMRAELAKQRAPGFRLEGLESLEDSLRKLTLDDLRGLSQTVGQLTLDDLQAQSQTTSEDRTRCISSSEDSTQEGHEPLTNSEPVSGEEKQGP
jgi:hypothetical protein